MCLEKKSMIPRIALKDIVVYKNIIREKKILKTPYTGTTVEIKKTYKGEFREYNLLDSLSHSPTLLKSLLSSYIDAGYIHSSKNIEDVPYPRKILVKCIIPKRTLYFIGKWGDIASRKLKYVEIIK